jgi:hypothetical protein
MLKVPLGNPMQGQIITQIMAQYYQGEKKRNMLMIQVLAECAAVMSAPGIDTSKTFCDVAWAQCSKQLHKNAQSSGGSVPAWLTQGAPTKG